jgi:hypothetical protein
MQISDEEVSFLEGGNYSIKFYSQKDFRLQRRNGPKLVAIEHLAPVIGK